MSSDPYAHFDGAYVLGALDPGERGGFEAHLATCPQCRERVTEVVSMPALLAGVDESAFRDDSESVGIAEPVPDTLLPGLLRKARLVRTRRRAMTTFLGAVAAACLVVLTILVWPSNSTPAPPARPMTALTVNPVDATVALEPRDWGTQIVLTCWYRPGANIPAGYQYELVAYDASGNAYRLGSWLLGPGKKITFTGGTALAPDQIKSIKIVDPGGTPILALAT